ncbi:LysE family translocator [Endozoicomonas numazuensis]|uniref:Lysine transporter LysE n=1 Tax=Endozoicomonas numazuensis TaxID=1137799 RepID=A0A081N6J3_9GAMM|nr:LysE family translocator [Endozoicomonas numazuensis]KEQ14066.1 lysine transporter LysE [Endozoicomonas numazuensis]
MSGELSVILWPLLAFAFSSTVTPGPNNVMIMTSGMNYGTRQSLPHFLGICLGFPLMVLCVGLGLGAVFDLFPALHDIIKVLGIAYLLYLAWLIAKSAPADLKGSQTKPLTFMQSALFQWVNPKAWIMATGAVAAYTTVSGDVFLQVLVIALAFLLTSVPCVGAWLFFGVRLKKVLQQPSYQRVFNITMALLLVLSIIPVINEMI